MSRRAALPTALAVCASLAVPAVAAGPVRITAEGVGKVRLGAKHETLKAKGLLGRQRPGCELAGPKERIAKLRNGARGFAELTQTKPRRVASVVVRGGATAKGVGVGDRRKDIRQAFPHARFDSSSEPVFGITIATVPRRDGGPFEFGIDTGSREVVIIGVPRVPFCD